MPTKQESNSFCKIAIDGHSSCGKSTLAKAVADRLDILYIDSGAMYRAVAFNILQSGVSVHDHEAVVEMLPFSQLFFDHIDKKLVVLYEGHLISDELRSKEVNAIVSEVATIPEVRNHLVNIQRILSDQNHVIMDGRDIGSVVFPTAQIKVFVTADLDVRAQRRYDEQLAMGHTSSFEEVLKNLEKRDFIDSNRNHAPLIKTEDAITLNNSKLSRQEQLDWLLKVIKNSSCFFS